MAYKENAGSSGPVKVGSAARRVALTGPGVFIGTMAEAAHGRPGCPLPSLIRENGLLSQPCDKVPRMTDQPDFRTDKSESVEGAGKAAARWYGYHGALDEDVLAQAFPMQAADVEDYPDLVRDDIAEDAVEQSDLIGFWVACPALAATVTVSRTWSPSAASCCASTTTTRSGPNCSPKRRRG
jgi:hypothetical protein